VAGCVAALAGWRNAARRGFRGRRGGAVPDSGARQARQRCGADAPRRCRDGRPINGAASARSSRTASPDPGSLVVGPHRARFRGSAGEKEAFGHATQFSRRIPRPASADATHLDGPGFGPREAGAPCAGARAPSWTTRPRV